MGYDTPRKLGDKETGGGLALPVWIDFMSVILKGVPLREASPPEGVTNVNGEWFFDEYAHNAGVSALGLDDKTPAAAGAGAGVGTAPPSPSPVEDERKSILDLFRR